MQYLYLKKNILFTFFFIKNKWKMHMINCKQMNALINTVFIILIKNWTIEKLIKLKNIKNILII